MARPNPIPILLLLLIVYVLMLSPVAVVQAYPHYLLNPEGCVDKKLEVGEGGRTGGKAREGNVGQCERRWILTDSLDRAMAVEKRTK